MKSPTRWPKTLVVEDDPNDAFRLHQAFKDAGVSAEVYFVNDGMEAVDYLQAKEMAGLSVSSTLPDLLLLKHDLAGTSRLEVLKWLRSHPHLRPRRVLVFGNSNSGEEASNARALGADGYLALAGCCDKRMLVDQFLGETSPNCGPALARRSAAPSVQVATDVA